MGRFLGSSTEGARYQGYSPQMITSKRMRGGHHIVGDRFRVPSTGVPGSWDEYVCSVAGFRGPAWTANHAYVKAYAPWGIFADRIEPTTHNAVIPTSGGSVFECTTEGTSDVTTEPNWALAPAIGNTIADGAGALVWTNKGTVAEYMRSLGVQDGGATLTTVNDTALKVLQSIPLTGIIPDYFRVLVTASETASGDGAAFELLGCWSNGGASVLKVPIVFVSAPNLVGAAWTAVLALNGTNIEVRVQTNGGGAKTVVWKCIRLDQERQG